MDERLDIVGVATDQVGVPKNDGSPGSALYRVPIRLSRPAASDEARILVSLWDRPPRFTSMHRPGIARVAGDLFILDGTTIDEVKRYHAQTVRIVVDRCNEMVRELRAQADRERAAEKEAHKRHADHVSQIANEIDF